MKGTRPRRPSDFFNYQLSSSNEIASLACRDRKPPIGCEDKAPRKGSSHIESHRLFFRPGKLPSIDYSNVNLHSVLDSWFVAWHRVGH